MKSQKATGRAHGPPAWAEASARRRSAAGSGVRGNERRVPDRRPQQLKALLHAAAGIRAAQELRREVRKEGSFGELANSN